MPAINSRTKLKFEVETDHKSTVDRYIKYAAGMISRNYETNLEPIPCVVIFNSNETCNAAFNELNILELGIHNLRID